MIKKIKAFIAVAALSGTVGANVQAAEVTVKKGDTLWELSQLHNTSVENIEKWNQLSTDLIHPGDVLTIATEKQYTVQQDDTLWDVALKYQVSVNQIKEWNNLNTDLIHPGLNLIIYDELNDNVKNADSATQVQNNNNDQSKNIPVEPSSTLGEKTSENENTTVNKANNNNESSNSEVEGTKELTVKATAYTASCEGCSGITATGVDLNANPNAKVIAVDPSVIPLGSKVYVEGYGVATAADTGGAIKGNRIDVFIPSEQDAINWGKKQVKVKILND
ncbi:LysM peptidoglycan-binding domain-containing protein [Neobacillus sp. WH10]|uniref:LysM peptidoglycan-binding and 3D domain-containing protein n=1 Tax=Neobacillus sp. WH10 TaxID=3047873 RepID=UPI0024C18447|nr:LysM peptidoglycan-binding and 3D domain-containing protein [Neobacillus sp. WH10]WHY75625.1 LysM peptidoglycan-binding domain-containing protein [Neobacillus sp. WH10]